MFLQRFKFKEKQDIFENRLFFIYKDHKIINQLRSY